MIIKKWNASLTTPAWEAQAVETTAQSIKTTMGGTAIFDSNNKILPNHLPDAVFDSLYFYSTANSSSTLIQLGASAYGSSFNLTRSIIGFYAVASEAMDITRNFTATLLNFTTLIANIAQGNTTITLTADTTTKGLAVGNVLTGNAFIPAGTTITSITNETQFVISNAPTGNQSSGVISFNAYFRSAIQYGEELNTYVRTFNLTSGSTTVTGGDTNNLFAGMRVSGVGMPGGSTTIASVTDSTTFVLAAAATANGESSLTFTNNTEFSSVAKLEPGDWFIITEFYGIGTIGFPFTSVWTIVNNTYELMKGASLSTAGAPGLVPAPLAGEQGLYLRGDGDWAEPTNTTYSEITTGEIDLGTDSTLRTITGRRAQHLLRNNVTATTTANLATGATVSTATKTVNLGTGGVTGSTTNLNIGSAVAGTTTINSPSVLIPSGVTTGTAQTITANALTSGNALLIQSDRGSTMVGSLLNVTGTGAMTAGDLAKFQNNAYVGSTTSGLIDVISTSTARAAGSQLIRVASSGANATASREVIGGVITVTNTGTSSTNTALQLTASGGTAANRALVVTAGDTVLAGDIAVNGGDITTSATTFNLIDATATTVNAFGAATSLNLGNDGTGAASTTNIATGAISTALTKAINIGTGGTGTSTTTITLGSATASSQLIINSTDTQIRAAATSSGLAASHFPVFIADPTTTGQLIRTRTAAQVRSDIGALATSLTTNTAPADGQHLMITSSGNVIQQSSITFDTTVTDTFLRRDGSFATPVGTQYTAGEGLTLTGTEFDQTYPVYHGDSLPTTGTISDNAIGFEW